MLKVTVDLTGLDEPGVYDVRVEDVTYYERRASRRRALVSGIEWTLVVVSGDHAGETIYLDTPLRSDLMWLLHRAFHGFGVPMTRKMQLELDDDDRLVRPAVIGLHGTVRIDDVETPFGRHSRVTVLSRDRD